MLWPQYEQTVANWVFPVMFGELAIMLWLIIMGAKERQPLTSTSDFAVISWSRRLTLVTRRASFRFARRSHTLV